MKRLIIALILFSVCTSFAVNEEFALECGFTVKQVEVGSMGTVRFKTDKEGFFVQFQKMPQQTTFANFLMNAYDSQLPICLSRAQTNSTQVVALQLAPASTVATTTKSKKTSSAGVVRLPNRKHRK